MPPTAAHMVPSPTASPAFVGSLSNDSFSDGDEMKSQGGFHLCMRVMPVEHPFPHRLQGTAFIVRVHAHLLVKLFVVTFLSL